jgi:hypothetical protein
MAADLKADSNAKFEGSSNKWETGKEPQGLIGRLMQIESACLCPIGQILKRCDQQSWEKQGKTMCA